MKHNLDKYWEYEKNVFNCPGCGYNGLWYDTHADKDSNYYCKHCKEGFLIVDGGAVRGLKDKDGNVIKLMTTYSDQYE